MGMAAVGAGRAARSLDRARPVEAPIEQPRVLLPKLVTIAADAAAVALAMVAALGLRSLLPGNDPVGAAATHASLGLLGLPIWLVVFARLRLYTTRFITTRLEEFRRVVQGVGLGTLALTVVGFTFQWYVARGWLALTFVCAVVLVTLERDLVRRSFATLRRRGRFLRPVVIVGTNAEAVELCEQLTHHPELGYTVVGFVAERSPGTVAVDPPVPVLGSVDETLEAVRSSGATSVIVASTAVTIDESNRLTRELTEVGVHVELSSTLRDIAAERLTVRPLGAFPIVYVEPVIRHGWRAVAKRSFDLALSLGLLLAAAPVLLVAPIAIKLDSRGPVLFTQVRVGQHGGRFRIYKLRTMVADAEARVIDLRDRTDTDGVLFKMRDDPRVTRVGRILRKFSLDELPQLWNVVRGEMSLVGPRPALPDELRGWSPEAYERLRVKPGLTGMWQVSGRSDTSFGQYVRLDLYYVDNWSLWTDLAIVAKTIPTVLLRRGAY